MRRSSHARRRSLMIKTTSHRRQSSVRRLRRRLPLPTWFKNIPFSKFSTWGILICVGMALFVGITTLSPLFRVTTFQVERTSPFAESSLVEDILQEFHGKNLLFLNKGDIIAALETKMPELREIEIEEDWPRTLNVRVGTSNPVYNIFNIETANFSVIADDGIVLSLQSIEGLPTIKIKQRTELVKLRESLLSPEQLQKIRDAEVALDTDLQLPIKSVEILFAANELHLISRNEMAIWLDLSRPIDEQLQKLKSAGQKIQLHRDIFDHIDLRIPQQIFWEER
jgi:hypothetical protein